MPTNGVPFPQTQTGSIIFSSKQSVSKNFATMANNTRTFATNGWVNIDLTELQEVMTREVVNESHMVERPIALWDDLTAVDGPDFLSLELLNGLLE